MTTRCLLPFLAMLMLSSAYGEGELNRFVDFEKNAAELKFIENPDFWAKEVDFSALSVWNDATKDMWGGGCERRNLAGVAISPRHVLCSHHYGIPTGTTLYFLGPKSGVVGRKVVASDCVAQVTDLRVCLLEEDLPCDITPLKILPENYADYLGDGKGLISATMNQYRELIVHQLAAIPSTENRTRLLSAMKPKEAEDAAKYKSIISGDSGCPRFLIINEEPILISLMWHGGSGSGVFIPHFRREIQNTMNHLAKGYELGEVSLAALPLYTPPSTEIKSPAPSPTAPNSGDANSGADNGSGDEDDIYDFIIIEDEYDDGEDEIVERVDIAAIVCANGVVDIEFKWPSTMQINKWDVFLKGYAELGGEATLSKKYNPASGTNLVVSVTATDFPESVLPHNYFFKAEAVKDSDHDGLSDELERQIGTDPNDADSDHDGLNDKFEIDNNYNPTNEDMDGDGVPDGVEYNRGTEPDFDEENYEEEEGCYVLLGSFVRMDLEYDPTSNGEEYENIEIVASPSTRSNGVPSHELGAVGFEMQDSWSDPFMYVSGCVTFRPTKTGRYSFQIEADDYAWIKVGDVKVTAHYLTGDSEEVSGLFIGGQNYEVRVFHRNNGGPTYLNSIKFGVYKYKPASVENTITENVILYEDAYRNRPDEALHKNSITTTSRIVVNSGATGGHLVVETENMDHLNLVSGTKVMPLTMDMDPYLSYKVSGIFEGCSPSTNVDDVVVRVTFTPNGESGEIQREEKLTVVQARVMSNACMNGDVNRHVFGPLERVSLWHKPENIVGRWTGRTAVIGQDGEHGSKSYTEESFDFSGDDSQVITMPREAASSTFVFSALEKSLTVEMEVVEPTGRTGSDPKKATIQNWRQAANNNAFSLSELFCGYTIEVHILPDYVSFEHVRIMEGVCGVTRPTGSLSRIRPHNSHAGAYRISSVGSDNNYDEDRDFVGVNDISPIDDDWTGHAVWKIPVFWQPETDATNSWTRPFFTYDWQEFDCTDDAKLSIKKLDCYGWRCFSGGEGYIELKKGSER